VQEGVVQEGVVQEIGGPLEGVGSPIPHKILTSYHDAPYSQRETISGRRRSVSFPVQYGIRSSRSSGSSNYPTGQDLVYNPYAWQWQPSQRTYGPPPPSGEAPPLVWKLWTSSTTIFKFIKYVSTKTTIWVWTSSRCTGMFFCFVDKYLFVVLVFSLIYLISFV
jgi:hypothetical protein